MNKISLIVLLMVIPLFIFVLGGGLGIFYQMQKTAPQIEKLKILESSAKALSSKAISSISGHGKVLIIEGREISLYYEGEVLKIKAKDDVHVFKFERPASGQVSIAGSSMKEVNFSQIKKGDSINIAIEILSDGTVQIRSITILPTT